ncbi:MAG: hypothetical protein JEZ06_05745 [Anaerolineaceae bacterium]|nr:hypothetical protein [Anaerolineaceae bacterium]
MTQLFDLLSIGEALIDLISEKVVDDLKDAKSYQIFPGGQVTNLAVNMSMLGKRVSLCSCVGNDGLGRLIRDHLVESNISAEDLQFSEKAPTTISLIARQTATPDFTIHRGADALLLPSKNLLNEISNYKIVHTSAFALSREPSRSTITQLLIKAKQSGCLISLDPNFHPAIWPDIPDFIKTLEGVFKYVDITKPSLDDCIRLFGSHLTVEEYAENFLSLGVKSVYITLGADGTYLANKDGSRFQILSNEVNVADVTGAGDAYWSGMLSAYLEGLSPLEAGCIGQVIAEKKLSKIGPIKEMPDWNDIKKQANTIEFAEK